MSKFKFTLPAVKPDQAVRWSPSGLDSFAENLWVPHITPHPDLACLLLTVKSTGGPQSNLQVRVLKCLHSGAIMVNNLLSLTEKPFVDKALVTTILLTYSHIYVNIHWSSPVLDGVFRYYGPQIKSWLLYDPDQIIEVRQLIKNFIDWMKDDVDPHEIFSKVELPETGRLKKTQPALMPVAENPPPPTDLELSTPSPPLIGHGRRRWRVRDREGGGQKSGQTQSQVFGEMGGIRRQS